MGEPGVGVSVAGRARLDEKLPELSSKDKDKDKDDVETTVAIVMV